MTIAILGAGALGCAIGAALTEAGQDVWLIGRPGAQLDALRRDGLLVEGGPGPRTPPASGRPATTLPVRATADAAEIGPVDLVIVLVKSFQTRAAMTAALPLVGPDTAVLSLQNGLGHEELLAEVVGRGHVLLGSTFAGGVLLGPGHVRAEIAGRRTWIGEPSGPGTPRVHAIAAALTAAGLETTVSDDMIATRWDKLLVNVATGAIAAITGLTYGQLADQPLLLDTSAAAVTEAMAVAAASGVRLSTDDPRQVWRQATEGLSADFKTSMLQSLERGRPTEIDVINGAVVRYGARHGVPTPVNATLVTLVKGLERALDEGRSLDKRTASSVAGAGHRSPSGGTTMTTSEQAVSEQFGGKTPSAEKYWDDAREGDSCESPTYTVTRERILAYAELSGDHTPVHVDEEYANASHFGGIVAHGLFGLAIADGLKTQSDYRFLPGMSLGWRWDFTLPIRVDDVLHVRFRVGSLRASRSRPGWGIVILPTELINQHGEVVQAGEHRLMVPRRPATEGTGTERTETERPATERTETGQLEVS